MSWKKFKGFFEEMEQVFGTSLEQVPQLTIVDSREEFEKATSRKGSPEWMVGFTKIESNKIIVFSEESLERESSHKKEEWAPLVKHEIVHLFFMKKFGTIYPLWLNEGLACYLSGQKKPVVEVGVEDMIELWTKEGFFAAKDAYARAFSLVKKLME